jgi:hypothetical protein
MAENIVRLHSDDMRFLHNLAESIVIAGGGMWEHDPEYRGQVASGFLMEARERIDQRKAEEDRNIMAEGTGA